MENPCGLALNQPSVQEKINQSLSGVCLARLNVMTSICTVPSINLHMHQNQSVRDQTEPCNLEFNISLLRDRRFIAARDDLCFSPEHLPETPPKTKSTEEKI